MHTPLGRDLNEIVARLLGRVWLRALAGPGGKNLARLVSCIHCAARIARSLKHVQAWPRGNARTSSSSRAWLGRGRGGRRASPLVRAGEMARARPRRRKIGGRISAHLPPSPPLFSPSLTAPTPATILPPFELSRRRASAPTSR